MKIGSLSSQSDCNFRDMAFVGLDIVDYNNLLKQGDDQRIELSNDLISKVSPLGRNIYASF